MSADLRSSLSLIRQGLGSRITSVIVDTTTRPTYPQTAVKLPVTTLLRYEDFVDGDRIKRIYGALSPGLSTQKRVRNINRDSL